MAAADYNLSEDFASLNKNIAFGGNFMIEDTSISVYTKNIYSKTTPVSQFTIDGNIQAFIGGYADLTWSNFSSMSHGYYYYEDSSIFDAEKCNSITQDDMMCWAGAASNMLSYTGWNLYRVNDDEDYVFNKFIENFTLGKDYGGNSYFGINWYFTGNYTPKDSPGWDKPLSNSGGFYKNTFGTGNLIGTENLNDYLYSKTFSIDSIHEAKEKLSVGYAIGLNFGYYNESGTRNGGHQITLWGLTYDTSLSVTDPNYYTGVIISDSDDNKNIVDPLKAPDSLKVISITYDSTLKKYVLDPKNAGKNCRLEELVFLAPNVSGYIQDADTIDNIKIYKDDIVVSKGSDINNAEIDGAVNDVMHISGGGIADMTNVSNGSMYISRGGVASNTMLGIGGTVRILAKGQHAGTLQIADGATVVADSGGIIDFTVADRTASDDYLINNLSLISGTPTYTITVLENQVFGEYKLAQGASAFTSSISIGDGTTNYGKVTVNGAELRYHGISYRLYQVDGNLTLNIEKSKNPAAILYSSGVQVLSSSVLVGATVFGGGTDSMRVFDGGIARNTTVNANGEVHVSAGGIANATTVNSGGEMVIAFSGVANSTTVNSGGDMLISSGCTALSIKENGGYVNVGYGANVTFVSNTINGITITDRMTVHKNTIANSTTVNSGGNMYISSGGVANSTTVDYGGLYISSGGTATDITALDGAILRITVASNTYIQGTYNGSAFEMKDAYISGYTVNSFGSMDISSGGVANNTTFIYAGGMSISSGGVANSTTVNSLGSMDIAFGGVANSTTMSGGWMYISSGGVANSTTVYYDGDMRIYSGGVANSTTVNSGGDMNIWSGGKHTGSLQIANGASVSVDQGGIIDFTIAGRTASDDYLINDLSLISGTPTYTITVSANQESGIYKLAQGAGEFTGSISIGNGSDIYGFISVNGDDFTYNKFTFSLDQADGNLTLTVEKEKAPAVFIYSSGTLTSSGAVIDGATLANGGNNSMHISSGGTANNTVVNSKGEMFISNGGTANDTVINSAGALQILSGGIASRLIINSGVIDAYVMDGGRVDDVTVSSGGRLYVSSGQAVNITDVKIKNGGIIDADVGNWGINISGTHEVYGDFCVKDNYASNFTAYGDDWFYINSGGVADSTNAVALGRVIVRAGALASNTDIYNEGYLRVDSDGRAENTNIENGLLNISGGGIAKNTYMSSGELLVSSGAVHQGELQIANGASVSVSQGGIIDFTIAGRTANADYLINDLSLISGTPTYTITVSANQVFGEYKLAQGAGNFSSSISIGDGTTSFGSITVNGGVFSYNGIDYMLVNENGNLHLTVNDITPPADPTYTVSSTELTNQDVTVTAAFSEDSTVKQYSWDGTEWRNYTQAIVLKENGTVYFRAYDASGNASNIVSYEVTNIDKVAPTLEIAGNVTEWTNQNVVLTATASDGTIEYFDGENWVAGSTLTVTQNGTYQFRVTDLAGNVTETSVVVDKIDKTAPDNPVASADIITITRQNVTVTATFAEDSVKNEYSFNGTEWFDYTQAIVFSENGTVYFRSTDHVGNVSDVVSVDVANIDLNAVEQPIVTADITEFTNQNVTVSAVFDKEAIRNEYSFDGVTWQEITGNDIVMETNGTIYFRSIGLNDKISDITQYNVTNIDKVAPTLEIAGNVTEWTNNDVVLTATASDGTIEYFDGENWVAGSTLTVTQNGTYQFRVTDLAGNITETSVVVDKIDKTAPDNPVASADIISKTREKVTVTATFAEDSVKNEYSLDGKIWNVYTEGIVFDVNGTVYFRSTDHVGNISETVFDVTNIDKDMVYKPIASANITTITNKNVTVTAIFDEVAIRNEYSLDGKNWKTYTKGIVFETNGTVYFRSVGLKDSISEITVYNVTNIDKVPPELEIHGNPTSPTHKNVFLSATANEAGTVEFFNGEKWVVGSEFMVTQNGTYKFRVTDLAGNVTETSVTVDKIDRSAPTLEIFGNPTDWTEDDVTLTAVASEGVIEYFDGKNWVYGDTLTVTENGTYYFRVCDAVGNYIQTAVVVDKIDRTASTLKINGNPTDWTNEDVILSAESNEANCLFQYSFDGNIWYDGSQITVTENSVVYVKVTDPAGHVTEKSVTVDKIDKIAPVISQVSSDITEMTYSNVKVTAVVSDDNDFTLQYKVNDSAWLDYVDGVVMSANGTVYFKAVDAAGNISEFKHVVSNIDKSLFDAPIVTIEKRNYISNAPLTVTAEFAEEAILKQYSFNGTDWFDYTSDGVLAYENGYIYFRFCDINGKYSDITKAEVSGIDHVSDSLLTEYVFVKSSYNAKNTLNKKQNGIDLVFGENAFSSLSDIKYSDNQKIILLDGTVSVSENTGVLPDVVSAISVAPKVKSTESLYSYSAVAKSRGKLNIVNKDTAGTEFEYFANVNISDNSNVDVVRGGNISNTQTVKHASGAEVTHKLIQTAVGSATVQDSFVGSVENYRTVKITDSFVGNIKSFASSKIINDVENNKLAGSVKLVRSQAGTVENYAKLSMSDSSVVNVENVKNLTISKNTNIVGSYVGSKNNDTLTVNKNAVLVLGGADFGDGKDKFVNNGSVIFSNVCDINAEKLSGKGDFAATSDIWTAMSSKVDNLLNLGQTYGGFRNAKYELADNTQKKAVKWDMKSDLNGWLNNDIGFEDTVDFIKFKAKESGIIKISGELFGSADKVTLNGLELSVNSEGDYVASVSAKTDYILKLERNEENSMQYSISLIA